MRDLTRYGIYPQVGMLRLPRVAGSSELARKLVRKAAAEAQESGMDLVRVDGRGNVLHSTAFAAGMVDELFARGVKRIELVGGTDEWHLEVYDLVGELKGL